jgi:ribosomal protein L11 methyltransferase
MPWRAVTLRVDADLAEATSDALVEAGAQSVSIEDLDLERPTVRALIDLGDDPQRLVARAAQTAGLAAAPAFSVAEIADEDWVRRSQAQFAPVEIGSRLWVGPSWREPPRARIAVHLDPGLAFGTGTHPTTQLVLTFLESEIRGGEHVLDYGCGSGILAIAAAKLGASHVEAVDVDPQALETACANARANRVELRANLPEGLAAGRYDIVVSNILAQPLIVLAPLLAARAKRGGRIALAGILEGQSQDLCAAYAPWFDATIASVKEGWALVAGVRR